MSQQPIPVSAPVPVRAPTMLNRRAHIQAVRSYRPMSPSRFLDHPLAQAAALFSHSEATAAVSKDKDGSAAASGSGATVTSAGSALGAGSSASGTAASAAPGRATVNSSSSGHVSNTAAGAVAYASLPGKERVDAVLDAVAQLYYRRKDTDTVGAGDAWSSQEYDLFQYPTLYLLLTPLRQSHALDSWSPYELALFEAGMMSIGKDFHEIHKLIGTKSTNDVVELYYIWKRTSHYTVRPNLFILIIIV